MTMGESPCAVSTSPATEGLISSAVLDMSSAWQACSKYEVVADQIRQTNQAGEHLY